MPTFEEFHITLNMNDYFWFEDVHYSKRCKLYYLDITSKATGEIIQIPLIEEQFDKLLKELEKNTKYLEENLYYIKKNRSKIR